MDSVGFNAVRPRCLSSVVWRCGSDMSAVSMFFAVLFAVSQGLTFACVTRAYSTLTLLHRYLALNQAVAIELEHHLYLLLLTQVDLRHRVHQCCEIGR